MEPPEETKQAPIHTIGAIADAGDMATFHSDEEHFAAIERLRPRDPCFILRASGSYTYARIMKRSDQGVVVQVDDRGATKIIPLIKNACTRYIGLPKQTRTVTISRRVSAPEAPRRPSISRANLPKKADSLRSVYDNRIPTRRGISRLNSRRSSVSDARGGLHRASCPAGGLELLQEMLLPKPEDQAEERHDHAYSYKPDRRRQRPPENNKTSQLEDHFATESATYLRRETKKTDDDKTILSLFEMKKQPSPDLQNPTGKQHSPREKSQSPDCASAININSRFNSKSHMASPAPIHIDEEVNRLEINC